MKVYLIETSSGSYEDYYTYIETGYLDKDKAQAYVDKYNKDLEKRKMQSQKCKDCQRGKYNNIFDVLRKCKLCVRESDISEAKHLDGDLYFDCNKSMDDYSVYDEHSARIKEVEVVE